MPGSKFHRKHIRLKARLPVSFRIRNEARGNFCSDLKKGTTRNVSLGGTLLEARNLDGSLVPLFWDPATTVETFIEIPAKDGPVKALAEIRWVQESSRRTCMGLQFSQIDEQSCRNLCRYAGRMRAKSYVLKGFLITAILAGLLFLAFSFPPIYLKVYDQSKLNRYVSLEDDRIRIEAEMESIFSQHELLQEELVEVQNAIAEKEARIAFLQESEASLSAEEAEKSWNERQNIQQEIQKIMPGMQQLESRVDTVAKTRKNLEERYIKVMKKLSDLSERLPKSAEKAQITVEDGTEFKGTLVGKGKEAVLLEDDTEILVIPQDRIRELKILSEEEPG